MKLLSRRFVILLGLFALLLPAVSFGDELPLEDKLSPGTAYVSYQGQNFRIATTVPVKVRFESISPFLIHIRVVAADGGPTGKITIFWLNFEQQIYNGLVPLNDPWEATLNTEGGFVDR